jgi:hypothetical protein
MQILPIPEPYISQALNPTDSTHSRAIYIPSPKPYRFYPFQSPYSRILHPQAEAPSLLKAATAVGGDAVERALCESGVPIAVADLSRSADQPDAQVNIPPENWGSLIFYACDGHL